MWGKLKTILLLLSVALNIPFIALWAAHATTPSNVAPAPRAGDPANRDATPLSPSTRVVMPPRFPTSRTELTCSAYRSVGVTADQWHAIEPRLADFRTSMYQLGRELKKQRDELVELVAAPELDEAAIAAKQLEIVESHRRMGELVTGNMLADRKVLNPEQQEKFFKQLRDYCGPASAPAKPAGWPQSSKFGAPQANHWNRPK